MTLRKAALWSMAQGLVIQNNDVAMLVSRNASFASRELSACIFSTRAASLLAARALSEARPTH